MKLDEATSDGSLFQVFAAATGKARSPIVQSRVDGTASAEVEDERSRKAQVLILHTALPLYTHIHTSLFAEQSIQDHTTRWTDNKTP